MALSLRHARDSKSQVITSSTTKRERKGKITFTLVPQSSPEESCGGYPPLILQKSQRLVCGNYRRKKFLPQNYTGGRPPPQAMKLSPEQIQQQFDKLQRDGVPPSDERMKYVMSLLSQYQQQQQANNPNGGRMGPNPNGYPPAMGRGAPTMPYGQAGVNNPNAAGMNPGMVNYNPVPQPPPGGQPRGITSHQLFQLRAQILAFKYLSRNMALPNKLLAAIRTFSMRSLQQQNALQQQQQQQQGPAGMNQPGMMGGLGAGNANNNNILVNALPNPNMASVNPNPMGNVNPGGMGNVNPNPMGNVNPNAMGNVNPNMGMQRNMTPEQTQQQYVAAMKGQQFLKMQQQQQQQGGNAAGNNPNNGGAFQMQNTGGMNLGNFGNAGGHGGGRVGPSNGTNNGSGLINTNNMGGSGNASVSSGSETHSIRCVGLKGTDNSNGAPAGHSLSNGMSSVMMGAAASTTQPQVGVQQSQQGLAADPDHQVIQLIGGKPEALQLSFVLQEREKRIKQRMQKRIHELGMLPPDVPSDIRRRASIEIRQIRLLEVRGEIAQKMRRMMNVDAYSDPQNPKRLKRREKEMSRETQIRADSLLHQRVDSDLVRRQKHAEMMAAVLKHAKDFKDFHAHRQKRQRKISKDIVNYHTNKQRQQQQEDEKKKRARLEALKNEDEDEYIKFLDEAKNERLAMLLKQTDEYLSKIGSLLQSRMGKDDIEEMKELKMKKKRKKGEEAPKEEKVEEKEGKEEKTDEAQALEAGTEVAGGTAVERNKKYYTMAHKIQEEITSQPDMIVGGKLKNYQLQGLQWLVSLYNNKLNGILADEMGLGKTIQTISLVGHLMEKKGDNGPFMVVVPLSTISNWTLEFSKWAPSVNVVVYKGKPSVRKQIYKDEIMNSKFNVVVISYEYVMMDKSDLSKIEWDYIIVDEGHRIKNRNSKLSNTLRQYMSRHRLLLTGTPLQNDLGELWSLLNFLLPQIFNSSDNFEQWFNAPFAFAQKKGKMETIQPNEEETLLIIHRLHKVLRPFLLRRLKSDVESELPDKVETVLKCELSAMQKKMYKTMMETKSIGINDTTNKGRKKQGFNNTLMQLQKICNHPYVFQPNYLQDHNMVRVSGKFSLIDRILPKLRQAGHRILIFNQMTSVMDIMEDYFQMMNWTYLRLDGTTKADERADMVRLWNEPDTQYWLFILSTKAGGLGLNLQTADTVIIFDTDWNPQADLQAQDRAHRIGQKNEVRVFRLVSQNSVEEKILERATFKLDVDAKVIQAGMFNNHANDKMRAAMLENLLHDDADDKELEVVTSDEQINSLIARSDDEYQLFQQMDQERNEREEKEWAERGAERPTRLMTEEELPEWMNIAADESEEDITETHGRGRRERPEVTYNISDVDLEESSSEGEKRKRSDDEGEEKGSKRAKKSKKPASPDSSSGITGAGAGKRPKGTAPDVTSKMEDIWNTVAGATVEDGTTPSSIFMKLPSKRDYKDYYQVISHPMSMKKIQENIKNYRSPAEFRRDFETLFNNAKKYNQQGSQVFSYAVTLQGVFNNEYNNAFESLPMDEYSNSSMHNMDSNANEEDSDDDSGV
ncbi:putative global transcription activator SNF2L2-like [Planoprotostelium fungivorum]|uniref:Putative global transcription activator SNF2L2-like n=1 Tax=Planoprotostelium fungivorum TaxID=1890364 RepID=A0A2P6MSH0_9EUKA|nr:putative global transcription activator SNF2L2-like [Planoprotostelium fungivorum]